MQAILIRQDIPDSSGDGRVSSLEPVPRQGLLSLVASSERVLHVEVHPEV